MRLRTTGGQATPSVVMGLMGKTTDFLSTYLLLLPSQYVVMTYFSSTMAYINGIQVINSSRYMSIDPVGDSHMKGMGMLLVSLWGLNYRFWSHSGAFRTRCKYF